MDSEVERFFPTASVNTTIVILKKQPDEEKRKINKIQFVFFTKPLNEIIKAYGGTNKLYTVLYNVKQSSDTEYFRLNSVTQNTLAQHTKWGQFLKIQ